ncbi:MAG: hypothetical protein EOQ89_03425 [Mesorhizobium sp.]|nr:MAG: hypothetical protein EOQ89_03425 [Mesorhizobium sp.]
MIRNPAIHLADDTYFAPVGSTMNKWSDDFGGASLSDKWEVALDVGGMVAAVGSSNLTVTMGTTANAELHLLSRQVFTSPFDLLTSLMMSQRIANNSVYIEAVEVDPDTKNPIAVGADWSNRASILLDSTVVTTGKLETVGDSSPAALQTSSTITTTAALVDLLMEIRPQDVFVTSGPSNSTAAKAATGHRHSSQVPDPNKLYKVRLRFKNGAVAPASSTVVTIGRISVVDVQELSVEIASGRGDATPGKQVPVTVTTLPALIAGTALIGAVASQAVTSPVSGTLTHKLIAAATTNATLVKTAASKLIGGYLFNSSAAVKYFKLFNKATAPVPGTDTPVLTFAIPAGGGLPLASILSDTGHSFTLGLGYSITGLPADLDNTAVAAGDVIVNLLYV